MVDEQRHRIKLRVASKLLRFPHARCERIPRHDGLYRPERILAGLLRRDQCGADLCIEAHLVVDSLAIGCKALLVFVFRLGEEGSDEPIVEIEDLIGQRRGGVEQNRDERGVTPISFVFLELVDSSLTAFTRQTQQTILMDRVANSFRQTERSDCLQALDMCENGFRTGLARRLP
ncbi:hypothetical protein R69746_08842 [Paraburkholderia aspalathi]|nr:hypothetical protein R69746_08842 [Paraburkholderia aspalathi]